MRLAILDKGHSFGTKVLFAFISPCDASADSEVIKLISYRPEFFGAYMKKVTHEAMRGRSMWSVGDRELMAALVSCVNDCEFCIKAHTAVTVRAYGNEPKVAAVLSDLEATPITER